MKRSPWRRHAGSLPLAGPLAARARLTPAGTSAAVVQKLQAEVARIVKLPEVRERMSLLGIEPEGGPTEDFARTLVTEIPLWTGVARANNILAE